MRTSRAVDIQPVRPRTKVNNQIDGPQSAMARSARNRRGKASNRSTPRLLLRHVLPHCTAPLLVAATLMVGNTILAESALSFLGLGVQVPGASWGAMLNEARGEWRSAWWLATFPGLLITLTVLAHNLVGDGLRDLLDPRLPVGPERSTSP